MSKWQGTEEELVAACIRNDRAAQEVFYKQYAPAALQVCRRYFSSPEEARELLNSGMLRVFQKLATFRHEGSLEGWVKRLVFRHVASHFRAKKQPTTLEVMEWDSAEESHITHQLYAEDLCKIIETLPSMSKEVFWLHAVEGYSHQEIGVQLRISEVNSRWHLNKARKILKELLASKNYKNNRYAG